MRAASRAPLNKALDLMSTLEALHFLWEAKWAIGVWLFPALFIALCATPEYMRHGEQTRMWFLKRLLAFSLFVLLVPCAIAALSSRSFWDALLLGTGKGVGSFIWGLIGLCASTVFFFAELAARERSRKQTSVIAK